MANRDNHSRNLTTDIPVRHERLINTLSPIFIPDSNTSVRRTGSTHENSEGHNSNEVQPRRRTRFSIDDHEGPAISGPASGTHHPPEVNSSTTESRRRGILRNSNPLNANYNPIPPPPEHSNEEVPIDHNHLRHVDSALVTRLRKAKSQHHHRRHST